MLYDKYKNKIQKVAKVTNFIYLFRFVFLSIFVLIVLFSITFISSKGRLKKGIEMPTSISYGEDYEFKVKTFFGGGLERFEYRSESSSEWTTEKPTKAGTYYVRAVTHKFVGNRKSSEYKFTINKASLDINITSDTITYGDYPAYSSSGLKNNDSINELTFTFDPYDKVETNVDINLASVKVIDVNGEDVTNCYNLSSNGKDITFNKRNIEINPTMDSNYVYSGEEVKYLNTYTITNNLGYSDLSIVEGKIYDELDNETKAILPGSYVVKISKCVIKHDDVATTSNYSITNNTFTFNINKRDIIIETDSASKTYDGLSLTKNSYKLSSNSPYDLLGGDTLKNETMDIPEITYFNEDGIDNILDIRVIDNEDNDVTNTLYNVTYRYGKLSIIKKNVTISTTSDDTFEYTGEEYSRATLDDITIESGSLADGDIICLSDAVQPSISEPGKIKNEIKYYIAYESRNVTDCYNITRNDGYLIMYSKKITIKPFDVQITYGDSFDFSKCFEFVDTYTGFEEDIRENTTVDVEFYKNNVVVNPKDVDTYQIRITNVYSIDKYEINVKENAYAYLTIEKRDAYVTLNDFDSSYVYDGNAVAYNAGNEEASNLVYNDQLTISVNYYDEDETLLNDTPINAGDYTVRYKSYVDQNGNSNNYNIIPTNEVYLTIYRRYIRIEPNELTEKTYDGNAYDYSNESFRIVEGSFVDGESIKAIYSVYLDGAETSPIHANIYQLVISGIEFINANGNNYDIDYDSSVDLIINPIKLVVGFNFDSTSKVYDGSPITYSTSANNFKLISGTILSDDEITISYVFFSRETYEMATPIDAGSYVIWMTGYSVTNSYSSDYSISCNSKELEITQRKVSIKPNDLTLVYGEDIEYDIYSYTVVGSTQFVEGDELNINVSYQDLDYSHPNVGSYRIVIEGYGYNFNPNNYEINTDGYATLTITRKTININLNNINSLNKSTYDGDVYEYDFYAGNYETSDSLPYDEELIISVRYQKEYDGSFIDIDEMKDAGVYKVIYEDFYVINTMDYEYYDEYRNNYNVICNNELTYTIEKKNVHLSLIDHSINYGDSFVYPNTNQYSVVDYMGFVEDDEITIEVKVMHDESDYTNNTELLHVGTYGLIPSTYTFVSGNKNNYIVNIDDADLIVNKRPIYVTFGEEQVFTYDGNEHLFNDDYEVENLANDDQLFFGVYYTKDGEVIGDTYPIDAGFYTIKIDRDSWNIRNGIGEKNDYEVYEMNTGSLEISQKEVRLKLKNYSLTYGSTNEVVIGFEPEFGYNFISGEGVTLNIIICYQEGIEIDVPISKLHVGNYVIKGEIATFTGRSIDNYNIKTIANSTLTITKRNITIMLNANQSDYEFTYNADYHYYDGYYELVSGQIVNDDALTIYVTYSDGDGNIIDNPIDAGNYDINYQSYFNNDYYQDYAVTCTNASILTINRINLELSLENSTKVYDGITVYSEDIYYTHNCIDNIYDRDRDKITLEFIYKDSNNNSYDEIVDAGKYYIYISNYVDNSNNYIFNGISNDKYYEIEKRSIVIKPINIDNKEYDSEPYEYPDEDGNYIVTSTMQMVYTEEFRISVEFVNSSSSSVEEPTDADTYRVLVKEVFDTDTAKIKNYTIEYQENTLIITPKKVVIMSKPMEPRVYSNTIYTYYSGNNNFLVLSGEFYNGDENDFYLDVKFTDNLSGQDEVYPKNVGTYYIYPRYETVSGNPNYEVTTVINADNNVFYIEKYMLENLDYLPSLLPAESREYDGSYYTYSRYYGNCTFTQPSFETIEINVGPLINDYYESVKDAGDYWLAIHRVIDIRNEDGEDVSNNYGIQYAKIYNFSITKKDIKIEINPIDDYVYTGYPVVDDNANGFILLDSLVDSDELKVCFDYHKDGVANQLLPIAVGTYTTYIGSTFVKGVDDEEFGLNKNYNVIAINEGLEFIIEQKDIDIYASSSSDSLESFRILYDINEEFDDNNVHIYYDGLIDSHTIIIDGISYYDENGELLTNNPKEIGEYYVIISDITILDSYDRDVTSNYNIINVYEDHKTLLEIVSERITIILKNSLTEIFYGDDIPEEVLLTDDNAAVFSEVMTDEGMSYIDYINDTDYSFTVYLKYYLNNEDDIVIPHDVGEYRILLDDVLIKLNGVVKDNSMFDITLEETNLCINQRQITLKAITGNISNEKYYDGTPYNVLENRFEILLNNRKYNLPYGDLAVAYTKTTDIMLGDIDSIINAGNYFVIIDDTKEIAIYDSENNDVSYNYDIICTGTEITIKKAIITLSRINPYSEDDYDGTEKDKDLIISQFDILINGNRGFINDEEIELMIYASYGLMDRSKYDYLIDILEYEDVDLEDVVICNAGNYKFRPYDFIGNHDNYELQTSLEISLVINRIEISITTGTMSWVYDGQEHSCVDPDKFSYEGNLLENHRITVDPNAVEITPTVVKDYTEEPVDNELQPYIYDVNRMYDEIQGDVTYNYVISNVSWGKLSITKKGLTISFNGNIVYEYNGNNQFEIDSSFYEIVGLVDGETASLRLARGIKTVGTYTDLETTVTIYNGKASNYEMEPCYVDVVVNPKDITFELKQKDVYYFNNKAYRFTVADLNNAFDEYRNDVRNVEITFMDEDDNLVSEFIYAGTYHLRVVNFEVKNSSGEYTTGNFNITITNSDDFTLVISKDIINVITDGASKIYDGLPLSNLSYAVRSTDREMYRVEDGYMGEEELSNLGLEIELDDSVVQPSITEPGEIENRLVFKVMNLVGDYYTNNFDIQYYSLHTLRITNEISIGYAKGQEYVYGKDNMISLSNLDEVNALINSRHDLQNIVFYVDEYVIMYRYNDNDDFSEVSEVKEIGEYRVLLVRFRVEQNGIDITDTIGVVNILNEGYLSDEGYYYSTFEVIPIPILVIPKSSRITKTYDGEIFELPEDFGKVVNCFVNWKQWNTLLDGHRLFVSGDKYLDGNYGSEKVRINNVWVLDEDDNDVTRYYNIHYTFDDEVSGSAEAIKKITGQIIKDSTFDVTLRIEKRTVNIVMPTEEALFYEGIRLFTTYRGPEFLTTYDSSIDNNIYLRSEGELLDGHYIKIINPENGTVETKCKKTPAYNRLANDNYIICDEYGNELEGMRDNYSIISNTTGKLIINPSITVTIKSASAEKFYDGDPLTCEAIESVVINDENPSHITPIKDFDVLLSEYGISISYNSWASRTTFGKSDNSFNCTFYDSNGKVISSNKLEETYGIKVEKEYGELYVKRNLN